MNSSLRVRSHAVLMMLAAVVVLSLVPALAAAAERPIAASWGIASEVYDEGQRCTSEYQIKVPNTAGAVSYRAEYFDSYYNAMQSKSGPPFEHLVVGGGRADDTIWGVTGLSGPVPCASAADYASRFSKLRAWAIFDEQLRIIGTVTDGEGNPIVGAAVRAAGKKSYSTRTNRSGTYSIVVAKGAYQVSAAPGFCVAGSSPCSASKRVAVAKGIATVNFARLGDLKLGGRVTVRTCGDATCSVAPLAGVTVSAGGESAITGGDGRYELELERGSHLVRPSAGGRDFEPEQTRVTLDRNIGNIDFETCAAEIAETNSRAGARTPCSGKLEWIMPERMKAKPGLRDGLGLPFVVDVYPASWSATVFVSRGNTKPECEPGVRYQWKVTGPSGTIKLPRGGESIGCVLKLKTTKLGSFRVTAVKQIRRGGAWVREAGHRYTRTVVLRDWLIAGFGDSNGSGEGNPSSFYFKRCNRGTASYQYQAALTVERKDPRSSVTFIHAACSGARVEHVSHTPYAGIRKGPGVLPPQAEQVADILNAHPKGMERRSVDAAIVSAGVNDLAFGPLLEFCVMRGIVSATAELCEDVRVRTDGAPVPASLTRVSEATGGERVSQLLGRLQRKLEPRFAKLPRALGSLGVRPKHVVMANYPDFTNNSWGATCGPEDLGPTLVSWPQSTWRMFSVGGETLNRHVANVARRYGYQVTPPDRAAFATRGYCTFNSLFVGIGDARRRGDAAGPFHPNTEAHLLAARDTAADVCSSLYKGDTDCDPTN